MVDKFTKKLKASGYNLNQCKELVKSGVTGYVNKITSRQRSGQPFYRCAKSTLGGRIKKKLTEKNTWFKKKTVSGAQKTSFKGLNPDGKPDKRIATRADPGRHDQHGGLGGGLPATGEKRKRDEDVIRTEETDIVSSKSTEKKVKSGRVEKRKKETEVKTVIFIPNTANSQLAKMLREEETSLEKLTGYRVKYVERAGMSIGNILCKSDHWSGGHCGRSDCLLCFTKDKTGKNTKQSCRKRNIVYETWCQLCLEREEQRAEERGKDKKKIKMSKYIGESAKSAYERGKEHMGDRRTLNLRSHMLKHAVDMHGDVEPEKVEFRMKVLKYHKSAFERQVSESIKIRNNSRHNILNSKGEYNRCALPRLGLKIGTREFSKAKEDEDREEERERSIEEKIRMLRKKKGKVALNRKEKETSAPKRRKKENGYVESRRVDIQDICEEVGEKRKIEDIEDDTTINIHEDQQNPIPKK